MSNQEINKQLLAALRTTLAAFQQYVINDADEHGHTITVEKLNDPEFYPEYGFHQAQLAIAAAADKEALLADQQSSSNRNVLTVKVDTAELKQVLDDFASKRLSYDRTEYVMLPRQLDVNLLEAGSIASDYDLSQERVAKVFKSIVNHYEITKQLKENKQ